LAPLVLRASPSGMNLRAMFVVASLALAASACTGTLASNPADASARDGGAPTLDAAGPDGAAADAGGPDGATLEGGAASDAGEMPPDAAVPTGGNEPPTARGETYVGMRNAAITVMDVLANDRDDDGDALAVVVTRLPAHGALTRTSRGAFTYTPDTDYVGEDAFDYTVSDGRGGEDTATARLFIAARTFYVAGAGDDGAAGTSPETAWRTLAKVQSQVYGGGFAPGDAVLFRRGDTYRGTLNFNRSGMAENPIFLGAYGTGARPVLSGARTVTGWTRHTGSVYRAPFDGEARYLFVDGVRQTVARHPNVGWLRTDEGTTTGLRDAELTAASDTYVGARVVMHAVNWAFESTRVSASAPGRLDYATPLPYVTSPNDWGYFLDDALALLDAPGEWFHGTATNELYLWAPGGVDPTTLDVAVASEERPLQLGGNYLVADGLDFRHALQGGLSVSYLNHHVTVRDCAVSDSYWGIRVFASDVTLLENEIHDTFDGGIYIDGARNVVERNHLHDISMVPGLGANRWGYMGLTVKGDEARVRHNLIERVGYLGMEVGGNRHVIEENEVSEAVSLFNDGGGIAFDFLDGVIFRRNVVHDTRGAPASISATQTVNYRIAFNMYFGDKSNVNTILEDNVLMRGVTGIHVDHTTRSAGNIVRRNTIYDHAYGVTFSDYSNYNMNTTGSNCVLAYDDELTENLVFSKDADQLSLYLIEAYCLEWVRWGAFDRNRYLQPFSARVAHRDDFQSPRYEYAPGLFGGRHEYFTLAEWKAEPVGLDSASTGFSLAWTPPSGSAPATRIEYNARRGSRRVALDGRWLDLDGEDAGAVVELAPYTARILLRAE
jgi:hypothetical protein